MDNYYTAAAFDYDFRILLDYFFSGDAIEDVVGCDFD
jgi:hypothetical protein